MQDADAIVADCKDMIAAHGLDPALAREVVVKAMLAEQPLPLVGLRAEAAVIPSAGQPRRPIQSLYRAPMTTLSSQRMTSSAAAVSPRHGRAFACRNVPVPPDFGRGTCFLDNIRAVGLGPVVL